MSQLPPANWYPDPNDPNFLRYWDGQQWTEHTSPVQAAASDAAAVVEQAAEAVTPAPVAETAPQPGATESGAWQVPVPNQPLNQNPSQGAPQGYYPAAGQQGNPQAAAAGAYQAPGAPKKNNTGKILAFTGAGVGVVALVTAGALILPGLFAGSPVQSSQVYLHDFATAPSAGPAVSWTQGVSNDKWITRANFHQIDQESALFWGDLDTFSFEKAQKGDSGWYKDYDDDYALGVKHGKEYKAAYDKYLKSRNFRDYPMTSDYVPSGYNSYSGGFGDGWGDTVWASESYSRKKTGPDPDATTLNYKPLIKKVEVRTGTVSWTIDAKAEFGIDSMDQIFFGPSDPEKSVVVIAERFSKNTSSQLKRVSSYNLATGELKDTVAPAEGSEAELGVVANRILLVENLSGGRPSSTGLHSIKAYDSSNLKLIWEKEVDVAGAGTDSSGFVLKIKSGDTVKYLDAITGHEFDEAPEVSSGITTVVSGQKINSTFGFDINSGYKISALDGAGNPIWEKSSSTGSSYVNDKMILIAPDVAKATDFSGLEFYNRQLGLKSLQRINPNTGEDLWATPFQVSGGYFTSWRVQLNENTISLIVETPKANGDSRYAKVSYEVVVLKAEDGTEISRHPLSGDQIDQFNGKNTLYLADETKIYAISKNTGEKLWEKQYRDQVPTSTELGITVSNFPIVQIAGYLAYLDYEKKEFVPFIASN